MKPLVSLVLLIAIYSTAYAVEIRCPGSLDHVIIEEVNPSSEWPTAIPEDKATGKAGHRRFEWNYLNNESGLPPIIAHCYRSKDDSQKFDLPIPFEKKKCIFEKKTFYCP
jgi:hypothetical protein